MGRRATRARASATSAVEMAVVARRVFVEVCAEVDAQVDDGPAREAVKLAYFERLCRSDMSGTIRRASEQRDPAAGQLFEAIAALLEVVPRPILATSEILISHILRPPAWHWSTLVRSARPGYWKMVRVALRADPRMPRRIASIRAVEPAFVFARLDPSVGPLAASAVMSVAALAKRVLDRLPGS